MNNVFRLIWNRTLGRLVVASEAARSRNKAATQQGVVGQLPVPEMAGGAGVATLLRPVALAVAIATGSLVVQPAQANVVNDTKYLGGATHCSAAVGTTVGRINPGGTSAQAQDGNGTYSMVTGCEASGNNQLAATAYGAFSQVTGTGGGAFGFNASAAKWATAVGLETRATSTGSTALGFGSQATANNSIAIGGAGGNGTTPLSEEDSTIASGVHSIAIGANAVRGAQAEGDNSIALGGESSAINVDDIAIGRASYAEGGSWPAIAIGSDAMAKGQHASAFGHNANASANFTTALGDFADASANNATAVGNTASASGQYATALGDHASAGADFTTVLGNAAGATTRNATAVGNSASAAGVGATSLGNFASATGANATALGGGSVPGTFQGAQALADGATAIGGNAVRGARAEGIDSIAMGGESTSSGTDAIAIGTNAQALSQADVAMGRNASVDGTEDGGGPSIGLGAEVAINASSNATAVGTGASIGTDTNDANGATAVGNAAVVGGDSRNATAVGNRAGIGDSSWNSVAMGSEAAVGDGATNAVAIGGEAAVADGATASIAMGYKATTASSDAIALGREAQATGVQSISIGTEAAASADDAVAMGTGAQASGERSIAIGDDAIATGSVAMGASARAGNGGAAFGDGAVATYNGGTTDPAIDAGAALGENASADVSGATALGTDATVTHEGSVALGQGSIADGSTLSTAAYQPLDADGTPIAVAASTAASEVSVGSAGNERRITNVAAGATDTDAVNVSQLKAVEQVANTGWNVQTNNDTATNVAPGDTVQFLDGQNIDITRSGTDITVATADDVAFNQVTIGDATDNTVLTSTADGLDVGGDQITNVQAGDLSATSTDAVNGSQLFATNQNVATNTTNITNNANEIAKGFNISADNGTDDNVQLGDTVNYTSGDNNIVTTVTDNQIDFGLASSIDVGSTNTVTIDGGAGTVSGLTNTTFDPNATYTGGQAATQEQLTSVSDVANKGWNVQANSDAATNVAPGDTVQFVDGKNIDITRSGTDITVATADDVEFNQVTLGDTTNNTVLTSTADGLDVGGDKITNVQAGDVSNTSTDAVNGSQLFATNQNVTKNAGDIANNTTKINNNTTEIAKGFNISADNGTDDNVQLGDTVNYTSGDNNIVTTVTDNQIDFGLASSIDVGSTNTVTIDGDAGTVSGLTNTTFDPNATYTGGQAATQEQLTSVSGVANKGWNVQANSDAATNVAPGDTVKFVDGKNIDITRSGTDITVATADDVEFNQVTIGDTTNNTVLTSTADGLDVGGDKITNVQAGDVSNTSTDAVNGSQLFATNQNVTKNAGDIANNTTNITNNATEIAKGFNISADNGTDDNVQLGDTVNYTSTDGNVVTTVSDNQLDFGLASSIDVGSTNPVTIDGDSGTVSGLTNTDLSDPTFATVGRAATEEQLDLVNQTANAGWNVQTTDDTTAPAQSNVAPSKNVDFVSSDNNIAITHTQDANGDTQVDYTLADNITIGNNLTVEGNTQLGDNFTVNQDGTTEYNVTIDDSTGDTSLVNKEYVDGLETHYYSVNSSETGAGSNYDNDGASGVNALAAGVGAVADGDSSVAVGDGAATSPGGGQQVAVGESAFAGATRSVALGSGARSGTTLASSETVAIGTGASADGVRNVALGAGSAADGSTLGDDAYSPTGDQNDVVGLNPASEVSVGSAGSERRITNVAAGATDTDAVNVSQLKAVEQVANQGWDLQANGDASTTVAPGDTVQFLDGQNIDITRSGTDITVATADDVAFNQVTIGDATDNTVLTSTADGLDVGGDKITNVQAGDISSTSTDAVNGSQLFATNQNVTKNAGDIANNTTKINNNTTEIAKGFNIAADNGTDDNVQLGDTVNYTSSDNNIVTTVTDNQIDFGLASSIDVGSTNTVTIDGDAGTVSGLTNTTFDPNATYTGGQAATQEQLTSVSDVANKGWNVQANSDTATNVAPGDTVKFVDGKNIDITRSGTDITVATADDVNFTNVNVSNNLDVDGNTYLGDNFSVVNNEAFYDGAITKGDHIVNKDYVDGIETHYYSVNDGGTQGGNYANDGATGTNALAAGVGASAVGDGGVAIGNDASALDEDNIAIGTLAVASDVDRDIGDYAAMAIGRMASATADASIALGMNANARDFGATAIGYDAKALGFRSMALGYGAEVDVTSGWGVAIGDGARVRPGASSGTAIGTSAQVEATQATAVGSGAVGVSERSLALGAVWLWAQVQ